MQWPQTGIFFVPLQEGEGAERGGRAEEGDGGGAADPQAEGARAQGERDRGGEEHQVSRNQYLSLLLIRIPYNFVTFILTVIGLGHML